MLPTTQDCEFRWIACGCCVADLASHYRPRTFAEVLGQESVRWVLQTLLMRNATEVSEFPSGVLLAGPSGVGKTTIARIVARALNCENGASGEPCLACPSCLQVEHGGHPAIMEVDAANCASADEARDLVARVGVAHSFRHLVLILDECHAMSRQAWDVLLRTLESTPPSVTFVFCTTSPDKLRPEVLSRLYRFDLTTPTEGPIATRLQQIAAQQGRELDMGSCLDIAHRARGNTRAAITLLEKVLLHPEADVGAVLGPGRFGLALLEAAIRRDRLVGVQLLDDAWRQYGAAGEVYADWMEALEAVLLTKYGVAQHDDDALRVRYQDLVTAFHETMLAAGMETVAEWARRGGRRAALSFAWTSFLKAIHGPTVVDTVAAGNTRAQARKAHAADLSNFNI